MPSLSDSPPRLGYVLKMYPRLSETFIVDEILALEEAGTRLSIFSLRPPDDGRFHGDLALVQATASYLPPFGSVSTFEALRALSRLNISELGTVLDFLDLLPDRRRATLLIQSLHLANLVRAHSLDHLHAHFMTVAAHTAYVAHLLTGVPFTVTAHAKDIFRHEVDAEVFRLIAAAAKAVVTVCDANKAYIEDHLVDNRARVERIYNGVFIDNRAPDIARRTDLILAVGRLVEKKGFHHLVDACADLRRQRQPFRCIIVGEGDQEQRLRRQIAGLDLADSVEMAGPLSRHRVTELMRTARVLVAPCIEASDGNRDALPTVILEALAHGLPVVGTSLGGIPEILDDGASGLLVAPGDVEDLAIAIRRLLVDDGLWRNLQQRGWDRAGQVFDRRQTALDLLAMFSSPVGVGALP